MQKLVLVLVFDFLDGQNQKKRNGTLPKRLHLSRFVIGIANVQLQIFEFKKQQQQPNVHIAQ